MARKRCGPGVPAPVARSAGPPKIGLPPWRGGDVRRRWAGRSPVAPKGRHGIFQRGGRTRHRHRGAEPHGERGAVVDADARREAGSPRPTAPVDTGPGDEHGARTVTRTARSLGHDWGSFGAGLTMGRHSLPKLRFQTRSGRACASQGGAVRVPRLHPGRLGGRRRLLRAPGDRLAFGLGDGAIIPTARLLASGKSQARKQRRLRRTPLSFPAQVCHSGPNWGT
jgi:hypothetical protein